MDRGRDKSRAISRCLPVLRREWDGAGALPQAAQGQVAGDGEQPGHGLALTAVAPRPLPDLKVDILKHVLRVLRVLYNGQGEAIDGSVGKAVQFRQSVSAAPRGGRDAAVQRLRTAAGLLCRDRRAEN